MEQKPKAIIELADTALDMDDQGFEFCGGR